MHYNVILSARAQDDLDNIITYILVELKNEQAARSVLEDYDETITSLCSSAGSIRLCANPRLHLLGYRRINFRRHKYFMLYRINGNTAVVYRIFHHSQDYESITIE